MTNRIPTFLVFSDDDVDQAPLQNVLPIEAILNDFDADEEASWEAPFEVESSDDEDGDVPPRKAPEMPPLSPIPPNFTFRLQCDLDSVTFLSTSISEMGWFFRSSSVFELNTFLQRTRANKHSKFRVCENPEIDFRTIFCGQPAKSVPLEAYPNIMLGQITQHVPFSLHLYFVGNGSAFKSNFLTNEQLQVLTAVMNASARLVVKTGLTDDPDHLMAKARYTEEMKFMSFVADDGKRASQSQLKNVKKQLSGATGKLFLTAMSNILEEIRDKSPDDWSQQYNVAAYVLSGVERTDMSAASFRTIASDLLECCVLVAESVGTKNSGLTKYYATVLQAHQINTMHLWMQDVVEQCHADFEIKMFPSNRNILYPSQCWHRLDYAFQLFPCSNELSFIPLLKESQQFTRLCCSLTRHDALAVRQSLLSGAENQPDLRKLKYHLFAKR
jgi:hypothetical protein